MCGGDEWWWNSCLDVMGGYMVYVMLYFFVRDVLHSCGCTECGNNSLEK